MDSEIMDYLAKIKGIPDDAIRKYLPKDVSTKYIKWLLGDPSYEYTTKPIQEALSNPIWEFLERGGKRWRPALFLLVNEALGGDADKVKDFTATLELLHEGSIMIDDIEDNSDMRRGKPCTHKIFGEDITINAGNFMYFLAFFPLIKNRDKFSEKTLLRAWETVLEETAKIHYGQATDIAWHRGLADADRINEKEYLQMTAYKTGVLARLAARLAVILNDGSPELEAKLGKFSESLGVAFQIQDDIMNLVPTKGWGKETGDDINEGKRTLLVIRTLKTAQKQDAQRLIQILNMHTKDRNLIKEAISIISKYGAIQYSKEKAKEIVNKAWEDVAPLVPDGEAKQKLEAFAVFAIEREI